MFNVEAKQDKYSSPCQQSNHNAPGQEASSLTAEPSRLALHLLHSSASRDLLTLTALH